MELAEFNSKTRNEWNFEQTIAQMEKQVTKNSIDTVQEGNILENVVAVWGSTKG